MVACATEELLTPRGLRTLSPHDPDYLGRYEGTQDERDRAYHQGTAWPWLLGFYTEAERTTRTVLGDPNVDSVARETLFWILTQLGDREANRFRPEEGE